MEKKYKFDIILRPATFGCGFAAFFICFLFLLNIREFSIWPIDADIGFVVQNLVGMVITMLTMLVAVRPDDPIPWHFIILFGFGFFILIFCPLFLIGVLQILITIFSLLFEPKKVNESQIKEEKIKLNYGRKRNFIQKINSGNKQLFIQDSEYEMEQKENIKKKEDITHYNLWFTDNIQSYMKNLNKSIYKLFAPYIPFNNMYQLFGVGKAFFSNIRSKSKSKHVISLSKLEVMRVNLTNKIKEWIIEYQSFSEELLKTQLDLVNFINDYITLLDPKPSPNYQMYRHHPFFKRKYFAEIITKEQAYWLGFLFADGYISLEHKEKGDYYRMGLLLARKDRNVLVKFCEAIGLEPKYIADRESSSHFSDKLYLVSHIRWGDQKFAQDLINIGMEYEFSSEKGRRIKIPKMPDLKRRDLMLAFLIGYYDGDGTLRPSEYGRVSPEIYSSNRKFLVEIKRYFNLDDKVYSRTIERINPRRGIIVKTPYSKLSLNSQIFEEMMNNYSNSLKRKRVSANYYKDYVFGGEKIKIHIEQKKWLKNVIKKGELRKILKVLSLFRISKILGVSKQALLRYAEDSNVENNYHKGHYIKISNSIRRYGKESKYFKSQQYWLLHLENIGKFNDKKQISFREKKT